jgi:alpha-N-acetylglucosamine transferase
MEFTHVPKDICEKKRYWITCITREEYLKGAIVLIKSLQAVNSKYSLILMVPKSISNAALEPLVSNSLSHEGECSLIIMKIDFYALPSSCKASYAFDRFSDVWNKLLCWKVSAEMVCWLDSDMLILQNMDDIFEQLPLDKKLAACPGNIVSNNR